MPVPNFNVVKYQLVIFDSDGTLADTLPWMRSVFNELADDYGFRRVEPDEHERFRDLHGRELLKAVGLPLWKLPQVVNAMRTRMAEHGGKLSLFDGMGDVLNRLSQAKIQLAIVSSNSRSNVERILGINDARLINQWNCGASMFGKASKIRAVVRGSKIPTHQAIYIGDELRDAEAANKAGVAFGGVAWGQHRQETLRALMPAEFFNNVPEIAEMLCG